jgi:cation diffusion facilitator family transporter
MNNQEAITEKKTVALASVFAAIFLTGSKAIIGILTGSLGILAEAIHSGLDLLAAIITYFSVRISDKPADRDHNFGHGKIENLSALIETAILLFTCSWIIYEAYGRLVSGRTHIEITVWSYLVVVTSIAIDFTRSRALMKAAKKHNSQALEADALHFSTDIWSSGVVFLGLICANIGLYIADSIAALIVAGIVIFICYRLGRRAIDALLDKAPEGLDTVINRLASELPEITSVRDIKIRPSGPDIFIDLSITLDKALSIVQAHDISHRFEAILRQNIKRSYIHLHYEPNIPPVSSEN